jgi:hypothetical protein
MNQDWEENEIRQLFRELRREDEGRAPSFAKDWDAALSQINKGHRARFLFRLPAMAAVALVLLGSFAFIIFRSLPMPLTPTATLEPTATIVQPPPPSVTFHTTPSVHPKISEAKKRQKVVPNLESGFGKKPSIAVRRQLPKRSQSPDILISQWRSPTDFLLKSPDDRLLRTIPRLNASTAEIKTFSFEEND